MIRNILFALLVCFPALGQTVIRNPTLQLIPESLVAPDSVMVATVDPATTSGSPMRNIPWAAFMDLIGIAPTGGAPTFIQSDPAAEYDFAAPPVAPPDATPDAIMGSLAIVDYSNANTVFVYDGATWTVVYASKKDMVNFQDAGGIEGVGSTAPEQEANWDLLKLLCVIARDNGIPVHFPSGQWEIQPDPADEDTLLNLGVPFGIDHIPWDGILDITGAGKDQATIKLPNSGTYFMFRQRTWDGTLTLRDLTIDSGVAPSVAFTVDTATDKVTIFNHGYVNAQSSLHFTTTGTLPAPLTESRAVPLVIDANTVFLAGENQTYGTLTPRDVVGNPTLDRIDLAGHGYANDTPIVFYSLGGTLPTGALPGTRFYVINSNPNDYQISLTPSPGAVVPIDSFGSGEIRSQDIINITTAGTNRTVWDVSTREIVSAGYHIGAAPGATLDTGIDRTHVRFIDCGFNFITGFEKVTCDSAVDFYAERCKVRSNIGVWAAVGSNTTAGAEYVDYMRSDVKVLNCNFLGNGITDAMPFGSHFLYLHSVPNCLVSGNTFMGVTTNAFQFQDENATVGAGMQLVTGNTFQDNVKHFDGAQSQDERSALNVVGNSFRGTGSVSLRSDSNFVGNYFEANGTAISIAGTNPDAALEPDVFNISDNTFVIKSVDGANAVFKFLRQGAHKVNFGNNVIKKDADIAGALFLGSCGTDQAGAVAKPTYVFHDNVWDINGDGDVLGWFMDRGHYIIRNETVDGVHAFLNIQRLGDDAADYSTIFMEDCRFDSADQSAGERASIFIPYFGWTVSGRDNFFGNAGYIDNDANAEGQLMFSNGRSVVDVASAATVYIDPSFDEFNVTGVVTIDTINIGVTGNVAPNAAGTNHADFFVGTISLILPSGITLSGAGNILNGPYVTSDDDSVDLVRSGDSWIIKK